MTIFTNLRTAIQKRAAYNRIKFEIANMPLNTAIDLGIFKDDAGKIASKAIYG
ncbi:MAG: hypothetical protein AAFP98_05685 [Pseudomonadota bacterium]